MSAFLKGKLDECSEPILPVVAAFCDFDMFGYLPIDGGIRDQDPQMIDDLRFCVYLKRIDDAARSKARASES